MDFLIQKEVQESSVLTSGEALNQIYFFFPTTKARLTASSYRLAQVFDSTKSSRVSSSSRSFPL